MSLLRREPLGNLISLRDAMDHLLEEWPERTLGSIKELGMLSIDMIDKDDAVVVKATVPGVKPENLEISTMGNTLAIKGTVEEEAEDKKSSYIYRERRCGSFCRTLTLPSEIKADEAQAEFENGILTLTLPKKETAQRKTIKIKAK